MALLSCHEVTKIYPDGKYALQGIDLELDVGLFGLLGPNGAGKTTLMEILTLRLEATSGKIAIDGIDPSRNPMAARHSIGYLPQHVGFHPELTAEEFLTYVGRLSGLPRINALHRADTLLFMVNLDQVRHERLGTYSGGMLRRVGIAQALVSDPRILVVDEPTAGLDPEERIRFRNLLFLLSSDRTVLLSTHIVGDVQETCSTLGLILKGRLAYNGPPESIIAEAEGATWECRGNLDDIERFAGTGKLVQTRETADGLILRLVGDHPDLPDCEPVTPNLEDAYVFFLLRQGALLQSNGEVATV